MIQRKKKKGLGFLKVDSAGSGLHMFKRGREISVNHATWLA